MSRKCKYYDILQTDNNHKLYRCKYDDDICYCNGEVAECDIEAGEYDKSSDELLNYYNQYKNAPTVSIPTELVKRIIIELKEDL